MKKIFYVLSILSFLAIILSSIFFSWYIAFFLIAWILCVGFAQYKIGNLTYIEERKKEILKSTHKTIADDIVGFLTKFYFSKDYNEFIKSCSYGELDCLYNWFACTKDDDSNNDIFESIEQTDFENMLYLSSNHYYDKNNNSTQLYEKAIETYNKIKIIAKDLF